MPLRLSKIFDRHISAMLLTIRYTSALSHAATLTAHLLEIYVEEKFILLALQGNSPMKFKYHCRNTHTTVRTSVCFGNVRKLSSNHYGSQWKDLPNAVSLCRLSHEFSRKGNKMLLDIFLSMPSTE